MVAVEGSEMALLQDFQTGVEAAVGAFTREKGRM